MANKMEKQDNNFMRDGVSFSLLIFLIVILQGAKEINQSSIFIMLIGGFIISFIRNNVFDVINSKK